MLAAIFIIVRWLNSASQKAVRRSIETLQLQIKEMADRMESGLAKVEERLGNRLEKVEEGFVVMDDRVRDLQMDVAVVKDRLHILTGDRPASPATGRAGASVPQAAAAEA